MICPLHGPVWREDLGYFIEKYDKWSRYEPEEDGVLLVYASMYGNTEYAAQCLATKLCERGMTNIHMYDVSKTHVSYLVSEAFRLSHIVLASVTYNLEIYPVMHQFLNEIRMLNLQNRTVGIIENGTWTPQAGTLMEEFLDENMKLMDVLGGEVTVTSSLNDSTEKELDALADSIIESFEKIKEEKEKAQA